MKLAILGGSFNPIHIGHIALAKRAIEKFGYDNVFFVPAFQPPHKNLAQGAQNSDRCTMISLVAAENSSFALETCEIDRGGTSYTIDTIQYLYDKYRDCLEGKIGLIIGADLVKDFHLWKDVHTLVEITDVLLAFRGSLTEMEDFSFPFNYKTMENALLDVSSQEIRNSIKCGKDWKNHVTKSVYEYIQTKELYS